MGSAAAAVARSVHWRWTPAIHDPTAGWRMYLPSRERVCVVPIAGLKTADDAEQATSRWNSQLDTQRARGEFAGERSAELDVFEAVERPPVDYQARVRQQRIAHRGFTRRADVITLLEQLDLPLQGSGFMIAPWPPR